MDLEVDTRGRWLVRWTTVVIVSGSLLCTQTVQDALSRLANLDWTCPGASCAPPPGVVHSSFQGDVRLLLPQYRDHFREAAERSGVDWQLLAAIGYQESRWNPQAVSPTGVRGLMMLTNETAALLKVDDREDAVQSIHGGSRLLALILRRLPQQIRGPDRIAMALAAYNQGLGHLLDARTLTAMRGGDPDRWADVRDTLPLLAEPRWYSQTRYGYARGDEAVGYVAGVRQYYEALRSATDEHVTKLASPVLVQTPAKPIPMRRAASRNKLSACLDLSHIGIAPAPRTPGTDGKSADPASFICRVQVASAEQASR
ncbi:MAG: mltF1 [Hydrocarboniphaga sp.]|nr:mltF1 [Hydrocarboniphaga sp.]